MIEKYSIFILLALICEVIGTISGFGSSILFVPIASLFFDFKTVLGVTAVFHVFSNISKIVLFKTGVDKNIAVKLGIPAVLFVIIGALITTKIQAGKMELLMNVTLIVLSVYLLTNINKSIHKSNSNLIISGGISGFLAGFVGSGGAVRGIAIAAFKLPKEVFIATSAIIDLGVDTSRSVVYMSNGYFPHALLILLPFLIGVSIVGSYLGKVILRYTSETLFRYIVVIVIVVTSVFETIKYLSKFNT